MKTAEGVPGDRDAVGHILAIYWLGALWGGNKHNFGGESSPRDV